MFTPTTINWDAFAFKEKSPWGLCLTSFLSQLNGSTAKTYCYYLSKLFASNPKAPDAYTKDDIAAFLSMPSRKGKPASAGVISPRLSALRAFYRYAPTFSDPNGVTMQIVDLTKGFHHSNRTWKPKAKKETKVRKEPKSPPPALQKSPPAALTFAFGWDDPSDPWGRCIRDFLRHAYDRSRSSETQRNYTRYLKHFFSRSAGNGPPKHPSLYTREDVEDYIHLPLQRGSNKGGPPSTSLMNSRLCTLVSLFNYAAQYTITNADGQPTRLFQGTSPALGFAYGKSKTVYRALSESEIQCFFSVIDRDTVKGARDYALYLTYFYTARRASEILRLKFEDLQKSFVIENGVARHAILYTWLGKGKGEQMDVAELPQPAYAAILHYLKIAGRLEHIQPEEPLFITMPERSRGKIRQLTHMGALFILKNYAKVAGLDPRRVCLHSWRHSSAQQRFLAGSSILEVRDLLRHSSLDTTARYMTGLVTNSDAGAKLLTSKFGNL